MGKCVISAVFHCEYVVPLRHIDDSYDLRRMDLEVAGFIIALQEPISGDRIQDMKSVTNSS